MSTSEGEIHDGDQVKGCVRPLPSLTANDRNSVSFPCSRVFVPRRLTHWMTSGSTLAVGRRLADGEAIVDGVDGAGHRPGLVRCEESEESRYLLGLDEAPEAQATVLRGPGPCRRKRSAEGNVCIGPSRGDMSTRRGDLRYSTARDLVS